MSNRNAVPKSKYDVICERLIGIEISDDDNDYGIVVRIDSIQDNGCEWFQVYTNLGHTFNAGIILEAMSMANLFSEVESNADRDDNVTVLPVGYPDGSRYSKSVFGPRKKHIANAIASECVNTMNLAQVSDDEVINITSHLCSTNSFPEENVKAGK